MELLDKAYRVVQGAEIQVRSLLEQSAALGQYDAAVTLAEIAKKLALLAPNSVATDSGGASNVASSPPEQRTRNRTEDKRKGRPRAIQEGNKAKEYPQFFSSGNDLSKVGWSKSAASEYEHRAPKSVALRLAERLKEFQHSGAHFNMEEILPLPKDSRGGEAPDYQVYLCLAWFRALGLVAKHGRSGYSVSSREDLRQAIDAHWRLLPSRSS